MGIEFTKFAGEVLRKRHDRQMETQRKPQGLPPIKLEPKPYRRTRPGLEIIEARGGPGSGDS